MLAASRLHAQTEFAIHSLNLLVVRHHFLAQIQMQTPVAEARMFPRLFPKRFLNLAVSSPPPIPATRSWHCHQLADFSSSTIALPRSHRCRDHVLGSQLKAFVCFPGSGYISNPSHGFAFAKIARRRCVLPYGTKAMFSFVTLPSCMPISLSISGSGGVCSHAG